MDSESKDAAAFTDVHVQDVVLTDSVPMVLQDRTQRKLKNRHIQLIGIGGYVLSYPFKETAGSMYA